MELKRYTIKWLIWTSINTTRTLIQLIICCDMSYKLIIRYIKGDIKFPHPIGICICYDTKIGKNVTIFQNVTIGLKKEGRKEAPIIENNVIIYANSVIVGDIKIKNNTIIGACQFIKGK